MEKTFVVMDNENSVMKNFSKCVSCLFDCGILVSVRM